MVWMAAKVTQGGEKLRAVTGFWDSTTHRSIAASRESSSHAHFGILDMISLSFFFVTETTLPADPPPGTPRQETGRLSKKI